MSGMISNMLSVTVADSPASAPAYEEGEFKMLKLNNAVVVKRGTDIGNPTVDLVFTDAEGGKYVVLATGGIIENLGGVVKSARIESTTN